MRKKRSKPYQVWGAFDTETTNLEGPEGVRAFPVLYIINDLRNVRMDVYEVGCPGERIVYLRHEEEVLTYIDTMVHDGLVAGVIPVLCAYNMMFDLQTILYRLHDSYDMEVNAQSSTNVYTLDLMLEGKRVMRIWDTYHLEMRGLKAMGQTCGVAKLMGDWDYDLIRTPGTELTDEELGYAARDVQVIPAYLRYLCDANAWLTPDMFACRVITKTSLVRQMARREIGPLKVPTRKGKDLRLLQAFEELCRREMPADYDSYALRLSCFRGGFTFTAASVAGVVLEHVCSIDETSAHHAFINGRRVPINFEPLEPRHMRIWLYDLTRYGVGDVLHRYAYPFQRWFHIEVRLTNIRLRKGSAFERWGIGLLAQAKFTARAARMGQGLDNERHLASEDDIRARGYGDVAEGATFAFGKLMRAKSVTVHVTELEWWCMLQVYEWDDAEPLRGEGTLSSIWPPDYMTLQSNMLFERKNDAKVIDAGYVAGTPYQADVPASIPQDIADALKEGSLSNQFVSSWYQSTVKGSFNSIYGTQAQNVLKPEYMVCDDAELAVNQDTKATPDNYEEREGKVRHPMVLYPYGMRIVGGSRMQLVIAIMLLYESLGDRVTCCGGDTDSIKVRCDMDVTDDDLMRALDPLHVATTDAIAHCMTRLRTQHPDKASNLAHIGCFEVERARGSKSVWYRWHMEAWNKARISITQEGHAHITCAGLSRPDGAYTIEDWIEGMLRKGHEPRALMRSVLGYNVTITHDVCHALEHHKPLFSEVYEGDVTDWRGHREHVRTHEAVALYPTNRKLGDTLKTVNASSVAWVATEYGRALDVTERVVTVEYDLVFALALMMGGLKVTRQMTTAFLSCFVVPKLYVQTEWGMEEVRP